MTLRETDAEFPGQGRRVVPGRKEVLMNTVCVPESKVTLPLQFAMVNKPPSHKVRKEKEQWTTKEDDHVLGG